MKKVAILVCLAMLISMIAMGVSAEEATVTSKLDFSTISIGATEDMVASVQAIKDLGAVDASNLVIFDCHTKGISGKGYAGAGYYVQRIDAGAGKVFAEAPVLTLNYRLTTADPMGYIKVEGSIDGVTYYPFAELNKSTGNAYAAEAKASTQVVLEGGQGAASVWVKVTMEHWSGPDAAAVDCSTISATVKDDPNAAPQLPENTVENVLNFANISIDATEDMAASVQAIKDLGAVDASNLIIFDCFTKGISGKGYAGPGYYIQKLEAGEGMIFDEIPVLTLNYRLSEADPLGYFVIEYSTDGVNYHVATELDKATGKGFTAEAKASVTVNLDQAQGADAVWVKVTMEHWTSPDGAAVDSSVVTATVKAGTVVPTPPTPPTPPAPPATGDAIGVIVALLAISGMGITVLKRKAN